jgi:glycosyltransferase involved in cell wall biosynthesis
MNLADTLLRAGHRVVLWSSSFDHTRKRQRTGGQVNSNENLRIRLIPSRGYSRNVAVGRLIDHAQMARNLKTMLRETKELPDVAFVGYPPIESAAVLCGWLASRNIPSVLDVKDQWPTLFVEKVPGALRPIARIALWPYFRLAKTAMRQATALTAMADSFLGWALGLAGRERTDLDGVFPLTSAADGVPPAQLAEARAWWDARGIKADDGMRLMFAGTHSPAFDFEPVHEAAAFAMQEGLPWNFVICGDGDQSPIWRQQMAALPNVSFPGWVDRPRLVALAERSQAALAPYRSRQDFEMSLPNKVLDALSFGLPVLSPLRGEVASLIDSHGVGIRYGAATGVSLPDAIAQLFRDPSLQRKLSERARCVYTERFSFELVYGELVRRLERLACLNRRNSSVPIDGN